MRLVRTKQRHGSMILMCCALAIAPFPIASADDKPAVPPPRPHHHTHPATAPATAPATTTQPAIDPFANMTPAEAKKVAAAAVNAAVANLNAEWVAHKKDGKTPLREKSDYFIENKNPAATHEEIVVAMRRSALGADVPSDTYVKWQLLSGIRGKIEDKLASEMLKVYEAAPTLAVRPGLERNSRRQLDAQIRNAAQGDVAKINEALQKEVDIATRTNAPNIAYREDLYAHLPGSCEVILAGLEDGAARAGSGFDADRHMKGVAAQITTWSVNGTPSQIRSVSNLLKTMINNMSNPHAGMNNISTEPIYADVIGAPIILAKTPPGGGPQKPARPKGAFPPSFYTQVGLDKDKHLVWQEDVARFIEIKSLVAMCQQLDDTAAVLAQMKSK